MLLDVNLHEIFECTHLKFTVNGRSKQASIDTHACAMQSRSLRLAPIRNVNITLVLKLFTPPLLLSLSLSFLHHPLTPSPHILPSHPPPPTCTRTSRVGSQFQFYFRSGPTYGNPSLETAVQNDSLLFHTSNRTAFLLGGWPEGAQVCRQSPFAGR